MTADGPGATQDYSNRSVAAGGPRRPARGPIALRAALALLGLVGSVLLAVSTFATVVQFRVLTTSDLAEADTTVSGGDLHGVALILVAVFALVMLVGAARGARPAMIALVACGLLAIGLIVGLDVPELDNTGELSLRYEDVSASASTGFYLETLGAVLLMVSGGLLLILSAEGVASRLTALGERARGGLEAGRTRLAARRASSDEPETDADADAEGPAAPAAVADRPRR